MKVTIEFDLPEDRYEYERAIEGKKWQWFADAFSDYLRKQEKYNENLTDEQFEILTQIREKFHELMKEEGLDLEIE